MKFLTPDQHGQLVANGKAQARVKGTSREINFQPVVRLFNPYGVGTWLLTEIDTDDPDIAWGLADLNCGCAEFGAISLSELSALRHPYGFFLIERDQHWSPRAPISVYIKASVAAGRIVEPDLEPVSD
jgi:hypothetical protein